MLGKDGSVIQMRHILVYHVTRDIFAVMSHKICARKTGALIEALDLYMIGRSDQKLGTMRS